MILLDSTVLGEWSFDEIHTGAENGWQMFGDQVNPSGLLLGDPRTATIFGEKNTLGRDPCRIEALGKQNPPIGGLTISYLFHYWFISMAGGTGGCHCCWAL